MCIGISLIGLVATRLKRQHLERLLHFQNAIEWNCMLRRPAVVDTDGIHPYCRGYDHFLWLCWFGLS